MRIHEFVNHKDFEIAKWKRNKKSELMEHTMTTSHDTAGDITDAGMRNLHVYIFCVSLLWIAALSLFLWRRYVKERNEHTEMVRRATP